MHTPQCDIFTPRRSVMKWKQNVFNQGLEKVWGLVILTLGRLGVTSHDNFLA